MSDAHLRVTDRGKSFGDTNKIEENWLTHNLSYSGTTLSLPNQSAEDNDEQYVF